MLISQDIVVVGTTLGIIVSVLLIAIMLEAKCWMKLVVLGVLCFGIGAVIFSDKKWLYGTSEKIEGVIEVYDDNTFTIFNDETKEHARYNAEPMAIGHKYRFFYDVPENEKQYITFRSNFFAYGDVQFHLHEEELDNENPSGL